MAAALAAYIGGVYLVVSVGSARLLGTGGRTTLSIAGTVLVALTFSRATAWAERVAGRLVLGERATPYEVLTALADGMAGTYATEDILQEVARIVTEGTGAAGARLWLRLGDDLVPAAAWPVDDEDEALSPVPLEGTGTSGEAALPPLPRAHHRLPVRHGTELIGALTVTQVPGQTLSPIDLRLLADIAAEAGLVLRSVGLTAELSASLDALSAQTDELRASRQRIVSAQEDERRRLERNIHDGAQQHLVALLLQLRLVRTLLSRDPARAAPMIPPLCAVVRAAEQTIGELAQGIHPPVLAEQGLAEAIRRQIAHLAGVAVEDDNVARYPPEVEAAAYFACLEAVQNASKHAPGADVVVRLAEESDELAFSVRDDGTGFEPHLAESGSGLTNMRDRLTALGGSLELSSGPGLGTCVTGRLPVGRRPVR